jgi:hypothetical protein
VLKWKLTRGGRASMADLHDPAGAGPTVLLCLYDSSAATQPLLAGTVLAGGTCAGRPCWRALGDGSGYRYKNRDGTPDGVTDLKLKVGGPGEIQLLAKGKGTSLPLPRLGLTTPVTLALVIDDTVATTCWQARFASALRNDATMFKATAP